MSEEVTELSCSSCKSRRNLVMLHNPTETLFDVKCNRHYTEYLTTKIVRLNEIIATDKKQPVKSKK